MSRLKKIGLILIIIFVFAFGYLLGESGHWMTRKSFSIDEAQASPTCEYVDFWECFTFSDDPSGGKVSFTLKDPYYVESAGPFADGKSVYTIFKKR